MNKNQSGGNQHISENLDSQSKSGQELSSQSQSKTMTGLKKFWKLNKAWTEQVSPGRTQKKKKGKET